MNRRHIRFFFAIPAGAVAFVIAWAAGVPLDRCLLPATDTLFLTYLLSCVPLLRLRPEDLRERAADADVGMVPIFCLAALAITSSLWGILAALTRDVTDPVEVAFAIAALPLGWLTLNTMAALHYAHLYYRPENGDDHGGLVFPGPEQPDTADFLYFAFTIGVAASVSDVTVTSRTMRRTVLVHSVVSFATNAVVLALAVNAAAG